MESGLGRRADQGQERVTTCLPSGPPFAFQDPFRLAPAKSLAQVQVDPFRQWSLHLGKEQIFLYLEETSRAGPLPQEAEPAPVVLHGQGAA